MKSALGPWLILFGALGASPVLAQGHEILTPDGLGPVHFGMSRAQVEKVLGEKLGLSNDVSGSQASCSEAARAHDSHILYMFQNFRVVRIDVERAGITTARGAGIGTREQRLKKLYPHAVFLAHPYTNQGHYVAVKYPLRNRELLFETDQGKVTSFRIGLPEPVSFIEGCD